MLLITTALASNNRISPGTLRRIPMRESMMAIASRTYFDWNTLPEIPGPLHVEVRTNAATLSWKPGPDALAS